MKVNNNSKFVGTKIVSITKYLFHISNIFLIVFYLYPGSIFGCFIYNDCKTQPQLTSDFIVSSNHVYVFVIIEKSLILHHHLPYNKNGILNFQGCKGIK